MKQSVFFEMEFILLVIFSLLAPIAIYIFLYKRFSLARWSIVGFALLLVVLSGMDVALLQSLSELAKATVSSIDDKIFSGQLSLALYLLPAVFAGLGVNLLSHVLVNHLNAAEKAFDQQHPPSPLKFAGAAPPRRRSVAFLGSYSEQTILMGSTLGVALIFGLDLWAGTDIRLHVLYVFPLALVARHCAALKISLGALALTTILQIITFAREAIGIAAFITDIGVAFAASLLIIFLARSSRLRYLKLAAQASTDALTGLSNRRAFMTDMEAEIARQRRYGGIFSLAVLDLDGFKALNDAQGHQAGDEALMLTAEILRDSTRSTDSVSRIGGDEFAVLMPNTQDVDCGVMLHKLCASIENHMAAAGFAITASIGCKTYRESPESPSDALRQADDIMYDAKRRGKNRAVQA